MIEQIRSWLTALVAVSILISVVEALIPAGDIRKIASFAGGLLLLLVMLRPVLSIGGGRISINMEKYEKEIDRQTEEFHTDSQTKMKELIEKKTESYILKQADSLGVACQVEVAAETGEDGIPRPFAAKLTCGPSEKLSRYMEQELGIPPGRQTWNVKKSDR